MRTDPYRASSNEDPWRQVWRASWGHALYHLVGAVIMLPFGLLLAAGVVGGTLVSGPQAVGELAGRGFAGLGAGLMMLFGVLFGAFLAYALLRHGGAMALDLLGARRTVEGPVEACGTFRGSKGGVTYWIELQGVHITVPAEAYALANKGALVRARCGRFERELTALWLPRGATTTTR